MAKAPVVTRTELVNCTGAPKSWVILNAIKTSYNFSSNTTGNK